MINPLLLAGQVHGGVVQGIGQALLEHARFDPDTGQPLTGSLMDYALPRADDVPYVETVWIGTPCPSNPLGVKGGGESGCVGASPAVERDYVVVFTHFCLPLAEPAESIKFLDVIQVHVGIPSTA